MPRIRTLKPEHRQHRKIGPLTDRQYRLWVGMVCEADDHGRLVADPEQLRVTIWGYHRKVTSVFVQQGLEELACLGVIALYESAGVQYAWFPSWTDHQRVDHPTDSRLPDPALCPLRETSRDLANIPGGSTRARGSDRIGRDQGSEGIMMPGGRALANGPDRTALRADARSLLSFLNEKTGRSFRDVPANLRLIEARLNSGASVQECRGVIARKVREWGTDPKMAQYLRPETLFGATKFESYRGQQENGHG